MLSRNVAGCLALAFLLPAALLAGDEIYFSRDFPGSSPEYFIVTVDEDGSAVYRESADDEFPLEFQVPAADLSQLFENAEALGFFAAPPSPPKKKTAFTGDKVLRYTTTAGEVNEAKFVLTDDENAKQLVDWFVKVGDTAVQFINLERASQFDRLGVNKAMSQFESVYGRGRIVAPEQFLPLLTKISKDMKIVHLARSRAAGMIERIEASQAPAP